MRSILSAARFEIFQSALNTSQGDRNQSGHFSSGIRRWFSATCFELQATGSVECPHDGEDSVHTTVTRVRMVRSEDRSGTRRRPGDGGEIRATPLTGPKTHHTAHRPEPPPILTPNGVKRIEELTVGDEILSRPEDQPNATPRTSRVEKVFELSNVVMEIEVGGKQIVATTEHPFYVSGKGWTPAKEPQHAKG